MKCVRAGDSKMTALHDAAVKQGAMQQLLVWIGFFELFGFVAIVQMLQGGDRQPGDFGFDPLNCAKDPNVSVNPLQSLSIAFLLIDNPAKPSLWRPLTEPNTLACTLICLGRVRMPARIPARSLDAAGSDSQQYEQQAHPQTENSLREPCFAPLSRHAHLAKSTYACVLGADSLEQVVGGITGGRCLRLWLAFF